MKSDTVLIHAPTRSLVFHSVDPLAIRDLLPRSRTIPHPEFNIACEASIEATRVLRNLGYAAPAPIRVDYDWPGRYHPFAHQYEMSEFLTLNRKAFNLSEMGTGKSAGSLWAADWLMKTGRTRKALIVSPLSTLERVWANDIFEILTHRTVAILHGSKERRLRHLDIDADFYIVNHEGLMIPELRDSIIRRPDIDLTIVDEAGMFRNASTKKYKALERVVSRPDMRLWLLTGTPCPNAPTDAWALARLVDPSRVPKFFGTFKRQTMVQVSRFKFVPATNAYETAYGAMQPAIRFRKADCLDLPPVTTQEHSAQLTKEQTRMIKEMQASMATAVASSALTAANAADQITKLRQIMCGAIKTGDDEYEVIPHGPRLQTTLDAIEAAQAKVIVVCPFKGIIHALADELRQHHTVEVINGDVKFTDRNEIIRRFKQEKDPHVLLCHPAVMSHGLNLTEADMLIFYAPIYSNDQVQQVNERFNRAGQTRHMTIVRIGAHPLEWKIYQLVDGKADMQNTILDLYKEIANA